MTRRARMVAVGAAFGALMLTGCQFASGNGGAACPDNTCGGSVHFDAAKVANGTTGGTVELDLSQRVYGTPIPIFLTNHLVGDVTCLAQEGSLATAVFEVDLSRSTITFGYAPAYAITVADGGPGGAHDGWRYDPVSGDPTTCAAPDAGPGFAPVESGDGFVVGHGTLPGES